MIWTRLISITGDGGLRCVLPGGTLIPSTDGPLNPGNLALSWIGRITMVGTVPSTVDLSPRRLTIAIEVGSVITLADILVSPIERRRKVGRPASGINVRRYTWGGLSLRKGRYGHGMPISWSTACLFPFSRYPPRVGCLSYPKGGFVFLFRGVKLKGGFVFKSKGWVGLFPYGISGNRWVGPSYNLDRFSDRPIT